MKPNIFVIFQGEGGGWSGPPVLSFGTAHDSNTHVVQTKGWAIGGMIWQHLAREMFYMLCRRR